MRRIKRDVRTEQLGQQLRMRLIPLEMPLAIVRSYKKAAAATCRIEHCRFRITNAERVDQIHHVIAGEVLAPSMPLFGADQALKDSTDYVRWQSAEIVALDATQYSPPSVESVRVCENL